MRNLTPTTLQNYVRHYDYEINIEQARTILQLLGDCCGDFTGDDIQDITEMVVRKMPRAN